jgi:hypothetical protein
MLLAYYETNIVVFTVNTCIPPISFFWCSILDCLTIHQIFITVLPWITIEGVDVSKTLMLATYHF